MRIYGRRIVKIIQTRMDMLVCDAVERCDIDNINVLIILMSIVVMGNKDVFNYNVIKKFKKVMA